MRRFKLFGPAWTVFMIGLCLFGKSALSSTLTYDYDSLGQLTGVSYDNGITVGYTYDQMGNRTGKLVVIPPNLDSDGDGVPDLLDACPFDPNDAIGDPCNHNDCADFSLRDNIGDPCNHNDCADFSPRDNVGDPCIHDAGGDLDLSFGGGTGKVFTGTDSLGNPVSFVQGVALQPDGKVVVSGASGVTGNWDFALVRYNPDGTVDTTFGTNGFAVTNVGPIDAPWNVVVQPDGRLVQSGYTNLRGDYSFVILRYNSDGSSDPTFGTNGIVVQEIPGRCFHRDYGVTLMSNGRILETSFTRTGCPPGVPDGSNASFTLVCYNTDGTLCSDFGTNGAVTLTFSPGSNWPSNSAVIQPWDNKILVYGSTRRFPDDREYDGIVFRLNTDGNLDTSFGTNGAYIYSMGAWSTDATSLAFQDDHSIVVGTYQAGPLRGPPVGEDWKIFRLSADGALDTSFGTNGIVTTDFGRNYERPWTVKVQQDGKIVAAGISGTAFGNGLGTVIQDCAMARYNSDGSLDTSYGINGTIVDDFLGVGLSDWIRAMVIQPDGNILTAGGAYTAPGVRGFAIARYKGAPTP